MSGNFSQPTVVHLSRKNSSRRQRRRQHSKKQHDDQHSSLTHLKVSQSNITRQSSLNSARFSNVSVRRSAVSSNITKTIINSKQNKIHNKEQSNQISVPTNKDNNSSNLSNPIQDFCLVNSATNSTACFDKSNIYSSLTHTRRITPINTQDLFNDDFAIDFDRRNRKRKISNQCLCKLILCVLISMLIIGGIIGILIYAFNQSKTTTTLSPTETTTQNSACTIGGMMCSTPMFTWNQTGVCAPSASSYRYHSCCYRAISTQLAIEFKLIEEVGVWYFDDISMTQSNGELIINGGFESNFTGWTVISSGNPSVTPLAYFGPSAAHLGSSYLSSTAISAFDYIKQTVNVIQGQNVNISFWWYDEGGVTGGAEKCEAVVSLTP